MMTISELRTAARTAHPEPKRVALARAAGYEVEVQKKFALPAACVVLTLAAIAIAFSVPRGRVGLVIAATCVTCGVYYVLLVAGESLANRLIVSPIVAMWGPNALLVATALLLAVWRRSTPLAPGRRRRIATSG
jgi:lipopolysaccharide export system permease protein